MTLHRVHAAGRGGRAGFTLIELLVVIGIIAILASMLLVGIRTLSTMRDSFGNQQKSQNIYAALSQVGQMGDDGPTVILREGMGQYFRFATLHQVFSVVYPNGPTFTPGLWSANRRFWPPNTMYNDDRSDYRLETNVRWLPDTQRGNFTQEQSSIGETLEETLEIYPDPNHPDITPPTRPEKIWYRRMWPTVGMGGWEASDWNDATNPGSIPVRLSSPWGMPQLNEREGGVQDTMIEFDMSEMSPMHTIGLLQLAGYLPEGEAGVEAYCSMRGSEHPWNDMHGNPLVIASAIFIPLRHDRGYDRSRENGGGINDEWGDHNSENVGGGFRTRDFNLQQAEEFYGFRMAAYVTVGCPGPTLRPDVYSAAGIPDGTPLVWDHTNQDTTEAVLRELWLQITDVTHAAEYDENAIENPPWTGYRTSRDGPYRCQILTPHTISQ